MKIKYSELIDQTLYFPQEEFKYEDQQLYFHDIPLMDLVEKFGTPLKFSYLPKISQNIQRAKTWFKDAIKKNGYKNSYRYCYCTKSSHFSFVLEEALKNDISIETSSAFDMNIVKNLFETGKIDKTIEVVCNGFKTDDYLAKISDLINNGFENVIPVLDNYRELDKLTESIDTTFDIGIRIASEEEPKFEFYTSRLGIGYKDIIPYYSQKKDIGVLITDHNVQQTLAITNKTYIMFEGKILKEGLPEDLANDPQVRQAYLGENFRFEKF